MKIIIHQKDLGIKGKKANFRKAFKPFSLLNNHSMCKNTGLAFFPKERR